MENNNPNNSHDKDLIITSRIVRQIVPLVFGAVCIYYGAQILFNQFKDTEVVQTMIGDVKYGNDSDEITVSILRDDGSVHDYTLKAKHAKIIDKIAHERELTQQEIDELITTIPAEDAYWLYSAMRRECYVEKGWMEPALSEHVYNDTLQFLEQYYNESN